MGGTRRILRVPPGTASHGKVGRLRLDPRVSLLLMCYLLPLRLLWGCRQPRCPDAGTLAERMLRASALPVHRVRLVWPRIEDHAALISHRQESAAPLLAVVCGWALRLRAVGSLLEWTTKRTFEPTRGIARAKSCNDGMLAYKISTRDRTHARNRHETVTTQRPC